MSTIDSIVALDIETSTATWMGDVMTLITEDGKQILLNTKTYKKIFELFKVCDITDEEYEEAVSIFDSLTEEGITEENKELFQEMKVIIEEYENGLPQSKENHFSVID